MALREHEELRVVLLHPLGIRGIALYTHNLANAISPEIGSCDLVTSDTFELGDEERAYNILPLFQLWSVGAKDNRTLTLRERVARPFEKLDHFLKLETSYRRTARWVRKHEPDVLHIQEVLFWWEARHILQMTRDRTRLIITCHNVEGLGAKAGEAGGSPWALQRAMKRLYGAASAIIVHGNANAKELPRMYPDVAARIRVIHHGCEPPPQNLPELRIEGRRNMRLDKDDVLAVCLGEVKPYKGIEDLIEAFPGAAGRAPKLRLIIAGLPTDPVYAQMLEKQRGAVAQSTDRVDLDFRYYSSKEMALLLSAADIVVLPHRRVYQSGVLCQTFTYGKPVVVTDAGALGETVNETCSGLVTPSSNPKGLSECLARLAKDSELRAQLGKAATQAATGRLSWKEAGRQTATLYRQVTEK